MNWNIPNWRLVAMMPAIGRTSAGEQLFWVIAENNGKFVVSLYYPESREWIQGHYFDDQASALGYWLGVTIENSPISGIDLHPRILENSAKLAKIINSLKGN